MDTNNTSRADRLLYRKSEAANLLGFSLRKIDRLLESGDLEHVKIGRTVRIPADSIDAYVASLQRRTTTSRQAS